MASVEAAAEATKVKEIFNSVDSASLEEFIAARKGLCDSQASGHREPHAQDGDCINYISFADVKSKIVDLTGFVVTRVDGASPESVATRQVDSDTPRPRIISGYDFAKLLSGSRFAFGNDRQEAVKTLRELADQIEKGASLLQNAEVITRAQREDFVVSYLLLEYVQKL